MPPDNRPSWRRRCTAAAICAGALVFATPAAAGPAAVPEESKCTRKAGTFKPGKPVAPPITLTADQPAQGVNFGGDRGWKFPDVVLKTSRPLPPRVTAKHLDLEVLRRLVRQGETTTTIEAQPMSFTEPRINPRRDTITFSICLNGAGLDAGRYVGAVSVEGPSGVGPVTLTVGAAAKDGNLFAATLGISAIVVFILLIWRGATTEQKDRAKEVAEDVKDARQESGGQGAVVSADTKKKAEGVAGENARVKLSPGVLASPVFWLTTLVSAALALGAAFTIYSQNTGWGADPAVDAFAVASAVLAAAGFRSLLLTTAGK